MGASRNTALDGTRITRITDVYGTRITRIADMYGTRIARISWEQGGQRDGPRLTRLEPEAHDGRAETVPVMIFAVLVSFATIVMFVRGR